MPRGGPRPNSGRPRKVETPKAVAIAVAAKALPQASKAKDKGASPLDFLLSVMRDEDAEMTDRFRAAIAAAPYVHAKAEAANEGVKAKKLSAANDLAATGKFAARSGPRLVVNS